MENIEINQEMVLLNYLYELLKVGNTDGVSEKMYYDLLSILKKETSSTKYKLNISDRCFFDVAQTLKEKHKGIVLIKDDESKLRVIPTYDLRKTKYTIDGIGVYGTIKDIYYKILHDMIIPCGLSNYVISNSHEDQIKIAEEVAAYYVCNLIDRYIESEINDGVWPKQCSDADKYIFEVDLARIINRPGTITKFRLAYVNATRCILELLMNNNYVKFSNCSLESLAYANYMKFVTPSDLSFLRVLGHDKYTLGDTKNDVEISGGIPVVHEFTRVYSEEDKMYSENTFELTDKYVKTMERKLSKTMI